MRAASKNNKESAAKFREFLSFNKSCFGFIDPGINFCGYALYECELREDDQAVVTRLKRSGCITHASKGKTDLDRTLAIAEGVMLHLSSKKLRKVYIEEPPPTIYNQRGMNKSSLVARAQSIFRTVGVAYAVAQSFASSKFPVEMLYPTSWQPGKSTYAGLTVKEWSLNNANGILRMNNFDSVLKTHKDINEADAINQGHFLLSEIQNEDGKVSWKL